MKKCMGYVVVGMIAAITVVPAGATAGQIKVTTGKMGEVVITATGNGVTIRKTTTPAGSETRVSARGQSATFKLSKAGIAVVHPDGRVFDDRLTEAQAKDAAKWLRTSALLRDGRALLVSLDLKHKRFADGSLLLTHALLNTLAGDAQAVARYRSGLVAAIRAPRVTRMALQGDSEGPGWCWDLYSKEAIKIAIEKENCYKDLSWWRQVLPNECDVLYIVEAEGAFFWYLRCVGIGIAS